MRADSIIPADVCQDYQSSSRLEWLDTNGTGFYAMGTVAGSRTRRYHGLLNGPAAPNQPTQVWLSSLEETLIMGGQRHELGAQSYPGTITPRGFELLSEFRLAPHPTWVYRLDEVAITREVMLIDGLRAVLIRYCSSDDAELEVRPFLAGRHHHELLRAQSGAPWTVQAEGAKVRLDRGNSSLYFLGDAASFTPSPNWYYRFQYEIERQRGLDFEEDLWTPGVLRFSLRADSWLCFIVSLEDLGPIEPMSVIEWMGVKSVRFPQPHDVAGRLENAAEHYLFQRSPARRSVIAGYPWFTDWGRDTFIALPGLLLARHRLTQAAEIIENFLSQRRDGLIPNRIVDDGSTPEYNSIDATLWLYIAVWQWLECGGDRQLLQDRFYAPMRDMLNALVRGTIFAIQTDESDGLLSAGTPQTQLTWMDARVNGVPATPRYGKAVEINALWYNALRMMTQWARERGEFSSEVRFGELANRAIAGFTRSFWNESKGCLYDCIRPGYADPRLRPNQLFVLSLPFPLVIRSKGESILQTVEQKLLTPYGLRTLAPDEHGYCPRYEGPPESRDAAYHQGTVWPWLLGPYVRACIKVRGESPEEKARLRHLLSPLLAQLDQSCLGQIDEVFDGSAPQRAGGTPAQAWSIAELLWVLKQELAF
jgi:predicted glycogen debranching enzyme